MFCFEDGCVSSHTFMSSILWTIKTRLHMIWRDTWSADTPHPPYAQGARLSCGGSAFQLLWYKLYRPHLCGDTWGTAHPEGREQHAICGFVKPLFTSLTSTGQLVGGWLELKYMRINDRPGASAGIEWKDLDPYSLFRVLRPELCESGISNVPMLNHGRPAVCLVSICLSLLGW